MALVHEPVTRHVVLRDISWPTYQAMLRDLGDERSTRLAYDRGVLEITMPSDEHETYKHLLERIITTLTLEFGLKVKGFASTTLSREDLQQSVEPGACYYIQNADKVQGRRIDLATDPPPDLVVEADVTNPSQRNANCHAKYHKLSPLTVRAFAHLKPRIRGGKAVGISLPFTLDWGLENSGSA